MFSFKIIRFVPQVVGQVKVTSVRSLASSPHATFTSNDHKKIGIHTCKDTYTRKNDYYIFKKCPKEGIDMNIEYLDTNPNASSSIPTVLAVHGAPGTYQDYSSLIHLLRAKDIRVIAPNFPNYAFTDRTGTFQHTTEEKMEFMQDWLKAIEINRIDVAVMHSSACFPTMRYWYYNQDLVKSMMMINPAGHRTIKAMKPEWLISNLARMNFSPLGRKVFNFCGEFVASKAKVSVKVTDGALDNAVLACVTMYLSKCERMIKYLNKLKENKVPTSFVYSDRDKLVDHKIFLEMIQMLGAENKNVTFVDKAGDLIKECESLLEDDWIRITCIKDGGHYAFKSCPEVLDDEVTRLLTNVYKTDVVMNVRRDYGEPLRNRMVNMK